MNFLTRLNAISHNVKTDQVPLCEMGLWGAVNDESEKMFKVGTQALMDEIEERGNIPFRPLHETDK
jgi:hypothetical protein